jgi:uncharacterized protein (DUF305 family)
VPEARDRHLTVVAAWVAMTVAVSYLAYGMIGRAGGEPDAEWTRQMINHHRQAVEMSLAVLANGSDVDVRTVATDILLTQQTQIGRLEQHLIEAEASLVAQNAHTMPGGASASQMASLRDADGVDADRIFTSLMIAHHRGAVEMSEELLAGRHGEFTGALARNVIDTQSAEIDALQALQAALPR